MLKDVNEFIEDIKLMEEKINLSLFEDFFEFSSPADYAKELINTSPDKNKKNVAEAKDRISDLEDRIEQMSDKEKKYKMQMRHLILIKLLIIITMLKIFFIVHQKLIKKKIRIKVWSIAERTKLRRQKDKEFIENIENKSKTANYNLFKDYFKFESPTALTEQLYKIKNKSKNNELVNVIKSGLTDLKDEIEKMFKEEKKSKNQMN